MKCGEESPTHRAKQRHKISIGEEEDIIAQMNTNLVLSKKH